MIINRRQLCSFFLILCLIGSMGVLEGCRKQPAQTGASRLTTGEAKKNIIKGQTTQSEIMQVFGSPNLVTRNSDGEEVWSYNRMSYDSNSSASSSWFILFGGSNATSSTGSKSFDLIITFDDRDVVSDYKVIAASY